MLPSYTTAKSTNLTFNANNISNSTNIASQSSLNYNNSSGVSIITVSNHIYINENKNNVNSEWTFIPIIVALILILCLCMLSICGLIVYFQRKDKTHKLDSIQNNIMQSLSVSVHSNVAEVHAIVPLQVIGSQTHNLTANIV